MKTKQQTEVMHETRHRVLGGEPFLRYTYPHVIVSINAAHEESHNLFEGRVDGFSRLRAGDLFAFQLVRLSQVPMKWYERVLEWVRR